MLTRRDIEEHIIKGTGTEHGIHQDLAYMGCARRARLDREAPNGLSFGREVGTVFHLLAGRYHSLGSVEAERPNSYDPKDEITSIIQEAFRLFDFYAELVTFDGWGRVVGTELLVRGTPPGIVDEKTGAVDMVLELTEVDIANIRARKAHADLVLMPGTYLFDHKTAGQNDSDFALVYGNSVQMWLYMVLYTLTFPERPAPLGTIVHQLARHKNLSAKSIQCTVVDFPTDDQVAQIARMYHIAQARKAEDAPNLTHCFDYFRTCPHLISGECRRL